jgi:carbon storage regulator
VVVLEASKDFVRLGIEAPPEVPVYRSEIYAAICEENAAAVTSKKALESLKNKAPAP